MARRMRWVLKTSLAAATAAAAVVVALVHEFGWPRTCLPRNMQHLVQAQPLPAQCKIATPNPTPPPDQARFGAAPSATRVPP